MRNEPKGPSVSEIKLRGDLDRAKRELQKLKKAMAAQAAPAEAAPAEAAPAEAAPADTAPAGAAPAEAHENAGLIADESLANAIVTLRAQVAELTETRHRLSRLYFQQLEDTRSRSARLKGTLETLGDVRGDEGVAPLLERLAECVLAHLPFRMVVARARAGERMVVAAFAGVPELARPAIAARAPLASEIEGWMEERHRVGVAYHIPHHDPLNAAIPGWVPTLDPRESHEWHAEDVLLVPVRDTAGQLAAVFSLDDPADRAVPSSETLEILDLVTRHAAVVMENIRLREALPGPGSPRRERRDRVRELRAALVSGAAQGRPGDGAEGRLERLLARFACLDRIEDALLDPDPVSGDLGPVLQEVVLSLQPLADRGRIALKLQNAATDTGVEAGRELLGELVLELGRNAIEFTPPGGTVNFRLSGDASDVMLEVADSGRGIAPARFASVFAGSRGEGEARGIGLAICKSIVEWHGGRIFLESSEGRGTRVSVILPKRRPGRQHEAKDGHRPPGTIIPLPATDSGRREGSATEAPNARAANERGR